MADLPKGLFRSIAVHDQELGTLDADVSLRVDKVDTVHGRCSPLVELARKIFHGYVLGALEVQVIGHGIGDHFPEHRVTALFQEFLGESEQVVHVKQPERLQLQLQVFVELSQKALGLHLELGILLYEDAVVAHIRSDGCEYQKLSASPNPPERVAPKFRVYPFRTLGFEL